MPMTSIHVMTPSLLTATV